MLFKLVDGWIACIERNDGSLFGGLHRKLHSAPHPTEQQARDWVWAHDSIATGGVTLLSLECKKVPKETLVEPLAQKPVEQPDKDQPEFLILEVTNPDRIWNLHTDFTTYAECERRIKWQKVGPGRFDSWEIATRDQVREMIERGQLTQTIYTDEAWKRFQKSVGVTTL